MGATKTEHYTTEQNSLATIAKALGHPARLAILDYLLTVENCICGDIVNKLNLAQSTISQHLRELKNANLIKGTIEGSAICYCIEEETITKLKEYFESMALVLSKKQINCC